MVVAAHRDERHPRDLLLPNHCSRHQAVFRCLIARLMSGSSAAAAAPRKRGDRASIRIGETKLRRGERRAGCEARVVTTGCLLASKDIERIVWRETFYLVSNGDAGMNRSRNRGYVIGPCRF